MPFNFPDAPTIGDQVTIDDIVHEWDGVSWNVVDREDVSGLDDYVLKAGDTMTGPLELDDEPEVGPTGESQATPKSYISVTKHSDAETYEINQLVEYSGNVYYCTNPVTAVPFSLDNFSPIAPASGTALQLNYRWHGGQSGNPGDGSYGVNTADISLATESRISQVSDLGNDLGVIIETWGTGDFLIFQEEVGNDESHLCMLLGAPILVVDTPNNYYTMPIQTLRVDGDPENNRRGLVSYVRNPENKLPEGGLEDQFLAKATDDNYDTIWRFITEQDVIDLDRVRWVNPYVAGAQYVKNDEVHDSGWLMGANKTTNDRAAPQPVGDKRFIFEDNPAWSTVQNIVRVLSGIDIKPSIGNLVKPIGYRFWAVSQDPNYHYEVWTENRRDPSNTVFTKILDVVGTDVALGWNEAGYDGPILANGDNFRIWLITTNTSAVTSVTGPWVFENVEQNTGPAAGGWNRNNQQNVLRINKTDNDSTDRSSDLSTLIAGTPVRFDDPAAPLRYVVYNLLSDPVDQGAYYEWDVVLTEQGSWGVPYDGLLTDMLADVNTETVTDYVEEADGTLNMTQVRGVLSLTGKFEDALEDDYAYGIDVKFQQYTISPDWDLKAEPGVGSGGGEGAPAVPVEIVEADTSAGWQVWGDVLIQWGSGSGTPYSITLSQPFKDNAYTVTSTVTATASHSSVVSGQITTGFNIYTFNLSGAPVNINVRWIAIGEAPDDLKKPKVIQAVGGSELQEYHDPAGIASWRIVGNTLECWGIDGGGGSKRAISFPKTFMNIPRVQATPNTGDNPLAAMISAMVDEVVVDGCNTMVVFDNNGGLQGFATEQAYWYAIGEWDGIS